MAWLFLAPALLLLAISVLIPAAMALVISFSRTGLDVGEPLQFIGLANFRRLLADPMLLKVSGTTFLYLVGVVPPILLGSLALAVLVNRQLPAIAWFRAAFYTPVLVSLVVAAIAFRWLYAENGLINGWLAALLASSGFRPIGFLTNPVLALPAVMLVTLWKGLGHIQTRAAEADHQGHGRWNQHRDRQEQQGRYQEAPGTAAAGTGAGWESGGLGLGHRTIVNLTP